MRMGDKDVPGEVLDANKARDIYLSIADTADHKDVGANKLFHNNANGTFLRISNANSAVCLACHVK